MRKLAKYFVIATIACFGLALLAGAAYARTTVQNQNSSDGGVAVSGNAIATNVATVNVGPQANSIVGNAQASQIGDNSVSIGQSALARTGDAVVNSQITGIVGGHATVQNQNSSSGGIATSGDAFSSNFLFAGVGPFASSVADDALASQLGDNDVVLSQSAEAVTGDAVLGSQVTGIVGGWDSTVQGQNSHDGSTGFADSGDSFADNALTGIVGPQAAAIASEALASQNGDNATDIAQDALAETGDSVVGSQVTGIVGDSVGHAKTREFAASL